mgnify:CR=1 FL=1
MSYVKVTDENGSPINLSNAFPVQLTGSIVSSTNYLQNMTITPGSSIGIGDKDFKGARLGIGVRLLATKKFKVVVTPKNSNGATAMGSETIIDQSGTAADRIIVSYQLKSVRNDVSIQNVDTSDITVTVLTITDFIV